MRILLAVVVTGFIMHLAAWVTSSDPDFRRQEAPVTVSTLFFGAFWLISLAAPNGGVVIDVIRGVAFLISLMFMRLAWVRRKLTKRNNL
jgi:hypothetical protein